MTSQLIPVFNGTIANEITLLCNARDLHAFLEVGKDFSTWIRIRISEYEFTENQDFILLPKTGSKEKAEAVTTARTTTSPSIQPKSWQWSSVTKKVARYADTSSSVKRNFAACNQRSNSQTRKSSSSATCRYRWRKHRTSANACIRY